MALVRRTTELQTSFDIQVKSNKSKQHIVFNSVSSDKSISQRAIILNSIANGRGTVRNVLRSRDIESCISILDKLGVKFAWDDNDLIIQGVGLRGLKPSIERLDIGNTATSARLIMSVLASYPFKVKLSGNSMLSTRPMDWVVEPLKEMGANITHLGTEGCLPLEMIGAFPLKPIHVEATVASAQEKSAILFAGLSTKGMTQYKQMCQSRDHTERLMEYFGVNIVSHDNITTIVGGNEFNSKEVVVPGDISSAAFLLAAYTIRSNELEGNLLIKGVGVNPTRIGFVTALQQMGLNISFSERRMLISNEPIADISCIPANALIPSYVDGVEFVQSLIDEVPLLAAVSAFADGVSIIRDCSELKDKDTNRIITTAKVLTQFGIDVTYDSDEIRINGGKTLVPAVVDSYGDHRMAMMAIVLASSMNEPSIIRNCDCISVSYPDFLQDMAQFADIEVL
ncbi:3-phosphoshikimate 1-carboxyvinyltransferase [Paenibacillus sp. DS2015]|uniref:3-phosphoshikimate 1-carboxyvinyltransferase n=1 Tax=Paenibacillus sp. DS2015 TaxID=3373917 RepID=UPI003D1B78E9